MQGLGAWVNLLTLHFKPKGWMAGDLQLYNSEGKTLALQKEKFLSPPFCSVHMLYLNKWERRLPSASRTAGQAGLKCEGSLSAREGLRCPPLLQYVRSALLIHVTVKAVDK